MFILLSYLNLFQSVMAQRKNNNKSGISLLEPLEYLAFETIRHGIFLGQHRNFRIWKPSFLMVPLLPQGQGSDNSLGKINAFLCSFRMQGACRFPFYLPLFFKMYRKLYIWGGGGIKNLLHLKTDDSQDHFSCCL